MPSSFTITATTNSVQLDNNRSGRTSFTVFNGSGQPKQGRAQIAALQPEAGSWFSLEGESERSFNISGTSQYTVRIQVPPAVPAGNYSFRLNMVGVDNPDEDFTEGQAVTFEVPEPEEKRKIPWKIPAIIVGVLILVIGAGVGFLATRGGGTVPIPDVAGLPVSEAAAILDAAGVTVASETAQEPSESLEPGLVTRTEPLFGSEVESGGEVILYVSAGGGGSRSLIVPEISNLSLIDAMQVLADAGVTIAVEPELQASEEVELGLVIGTVPPITSEIDQETPVTVIISAGSDRVDVPALNSDQSERTNQTSVQFEFAGSNSQTIDCQLDGGDWEPCSTSAEGAKNYDGLGDGSHVFSVRAVNESGAVSNPATIVWTIDTQVLPPTVELNPSTITLEPLAQFAFSSGEPVDFQCKLSDMEWESCGAGQNGQYEVTDLTDGTYTFQVRGTDGTGNESGPTPGFTWTVDTLPPSVVIESSPGGPTNVTTADFAFSSPESDVTFECKLETDLEWSDCSDGSQSYSDLPDLEQAFLVRAIDAAGNVSDPPERFTWVVDTIAPSAAIETGPTGPTNETSAEITYSSPDGGASFECKLKSETEWAICSGEPASYSGLSDGQYTFQVRAVDLAANVGDTVEQTWTVDTQGGVIPTISTGPEQITRETSARFFYGSTDAAQFECKLNSEAWIPCGDGPAADKNYTGLPNQEHAFQVRAVDALGNRGQEAQFTWTVDTQSPRVTALAASQTPFSPDGNGILDTSVISAQLSERSEVTVKIRDSNKVVVRTFAPLSTSAYSSSWDGKNDSNAVLNSGTYSVEITAVDPAGNIGSTDEIPIVVDTIAPETAFTTSPLASFTNTSSNQFAFTSSSQDTASYECKVDKGSWGSCTSGVSYDLSDGQHTVGVRAVDRAGNRDLSPASHTFVVDTVSPVVKIGRASIISSSFPNFKIRAEFTATDANMSNITCKYGTRTNTSCSSPWTFNVVTGSLTVTATDKAGNRTTARQ